MPVTFDKLIGEPLMHSHDGSDITSAVASATNADTVDSLHASAFALAVLVDTRANILATNPATVRIAFATDYNRFYLSDGTAWHGAPVRYGHPSTTVDMGALPFEDDQGYSESDIANKTLHTVAIGGYDTAQVAAKNGAVKFDPATITLLAYLNAAWKTIITMTAAEVLDVMNYSDPWQTKDAYGQNVMTLDHQTSMGAFAYPQFIDGGLISDQL